MAFWSLEVGLVNMTKPKLRIVNDKPTHYTVGAIIEKDNKYLLIDRALPPYGWAGIAGHIGDDENPDDAIIRKVLEESNLDVINRYLLLEEIIPWNTCRDDIDQHHWFLYNCLTEGKVNPNPDGIKSFQWAFKEEISKLNLEPVWDYLFRKLNIIF